MSVSPANVRQSRSERTITTYRWQWRRFDAYCAAHGEPALPAAPATVARYLADTDAEGKAPATLRLALVAINRAHKDAREPSPTGDVLVVATMAGIQRQRGTAQRQAPALLPEHIAAIRATACQPRSIGRGRETPAAAERRGLMDIALASVLSTAGLRRSEAAALDWGDVTAEPSDGSGRLTVRKSKTDQAGIGATVFIPTAAMAALAAIRPQRVAPDAPVFTSTRGSRMTGETVSNRLRQACKAAGLGADFSGHSGRVGMARTMVRRGAPLPIVAQQGRWNGLQMVNTYTRNEQAAAASPYLE